MEKKKVILTLCKSFPVTHSKAGEATDFEKKLKDKSKIHTIRYNAKNVWNGRYKDIVSGKKYLSIREWTGRPYNSEQKEIAQLPKIGLQHVTMTYSSEDAYPEIWIDNKKVSIHEVAKNGFSGTTKRMFLKVQLFILQIFGTDMSEQELKEQLGDELCEFCPWRKGEIDHTFDSLCEGSYCDDAFDNFLDENEGYFDDEE